MLIGGVIDHQVDDDANPPLLGTVGELDEVAQCPMGGIHAVVVGHIVTVVAAWRGLERHEPDRGDAQPVEVVQAAHESLEVPDSVSVGVHEGADGEAIDDRVLVPEIVDRRRRSGGSTRSVAARSSFQRQGHLL
jgi:hypothetical protein